MEIVDLTMINIEQNNGTTNAKPVVLDVPTAKDLSPLMIVWVRQIVITVIGAFGQSTLTKSKVTGALIVAVAWDQSA